MPASWGPSFLCPPASWVQLSKTSYGLSHSAGTSSVKPAFRAHFWLPYQRSGCTSFQAQFGQTQLSWSASFLVTFWSKFCFPVALNESYALNVSETCRKAKSQNDPRKMTLPES